MDRGGHLTGPSHSVSLCRQTAALTLRYRIKFRPRCSRHQLAFGGSDMHTCTALHREQL